ncbi:UNVERIFIED_CONTAM: Ubiquitin carboxyl-terminal hydrolase 12 [Sesamum latifolium]|uniref:ubiquitinyl hydrolase 1 n=1 Tax=Sesamum latifolium TaxID=2727402 RepID=A0AAW2VX55_9LAMI
MLENNIKLVLVECYLEAIHFRSLERPTEDEFCLQLSKLDSYDDVVERVANQLGVDDPSKLRLTSHNVYSQRPKAHPIRYRGVESLLEMLLHYDQLSDILYFEVLDIPLPELQKLRILKLAFSHAAKTELETYSIRLPKESTVGDVLEHLKEKVKLYHPSAELRLLEVFSHKIYKWRFAFVSHSQAKYLEDSDTLFDYFQGSGICVSWERYLGLEHVNNTPRRPPGANQNGSSGCPGTGRNFTYEILINGLCKAQKHSLAIELLPGMLKNKCEANVRMYNMIIDALCKEGKMIEAARVFEEMIGQRISGDVVAYCSLINGFCRLGKCTEAVRYSDQMVCEGISLDECTYNSLIHGFCQFNLLEVAIKVFNHMKHKADCLADAEDLFKSMGDKRIKHDVVIYNTLIYGYCKGRLTDNAIALFSQMLEKGLKPMNAT